MADRDRAIEHMEADFLPDQRVGVEHRVANALDYIAYHIGQIDKKLETIERALTKTAQKS